MAADQQTNASFREVGASLRRTGRLQGQRRQHGRPQHRLLLLLLLPRLLRRQLLLLLRLRLLLLLELLQRGGRRRPQLRQLLLP